MKKTLAVLVALMMALALLPALGETAYTPGTYEGTAQGHLGTVKVKVTLAKDKIEAIEVIESAETGGIGDVAAERVIKDVLDNQSLAVDAVTGCTVSANAFRMAIEDALTVAGANVQALREVPKAEQPKVERELSVDVCVVGSGAAGLMAALEAAEAGAKVVILECLSRNGGSTRTSSAMIVAGGTPLQAEAGIEDSVDNLKAYWRERGEGLVDVQQTDYVAEHINDSLAKLMELGVPYVSSLILQSGTATVNRAHLPVGFGVALCDVLTQKLSDMGVDILYDTRAESLLQADDAVTGVVATSRQGKLTVNAGAVVLATGGYGWNPNMVKEYAPDAEGAWPVSSPGSTGDGITMAMAVGADTVFKGGFIGWKVVNPVHGHTSPIGAPIYGAANLIVNPKGDRFGNEAEDYPFLYNSMRSDGGDKFYFIFETAQGETRDLVDNVSDTIANLEKGVEAKLCFKADTIEELAQVAGLTNLKATVDAWNAAIKAGKDDTFGRDTATMTLIENGPFYALQSMRATLGTFGGLKTQITGEVLTPQGTPIPGLYAAGEVANGDFFPVIYPASGSALSMCIVLGQEAGRSAAAFVQR